MCKVHIYYFFFYHVLRCLSRAEHNATVFLPAHSQNDFIAPFMWNVHAIFYPPRRTQLIPLLSIKEKKKKTYLVFFYFDAITQLGSQSMFFFLNNQFVRCALLWRALAKCLSTPGSELFVRCMHYIHDFQIILVFLEIFKLLRFVIRFCFPRWNYIIEACILHESNLKIACLNAALQQWVTARWEDIFFVFDIEVLSQWLYLWW